MFFRKFPTALAAAVLFSMAAAAFSPAIPRPLIDMTIPTPSGKSVQLKQYKGKVMIVMLIATDCVHCGETVDLLEKIQKDYPPAKFQIVSSSINSKIEVQAFLTAHKVSFPIGFLDDDSNMKLFDFKRADHPISPMLMFVDKKGMVRVQYHGDNDNFMKNQESNIRLLIDSLMKE